METLTAWIALKTNVLFFIFSTQLLLSDSSPLSQDSRSDNGACSKGWIHYERFCVTQAKGQSDSAVALYCNGFGGVGINGYCITKAHNTEALDSFDTSKDISVSGGLGDELWRAAAHKTEAEEEREEGGSLGNLIDTSAADSDDQYGSSIEEIVCPKGWKHYGKICVYQPLSMKEQCHLLNAVSFSGLCLKHADMDAIERRGLKDSGSGKEKRVCCCAHVRAKANGYGCY